jgi:hypothetical protein
MTATEHPTEKVQKSDTYKRNYNLMRISYIACWISLAILLILLLFTPYEHGATKHMVIFSTLAIFFQISAARCGIACDIAKIEEKIDGKR